MNEFKDMMYCPFCDKYYKKRSVYCFFCGRVLDVYEIWKCRTDKSQEKWKAKHAEEGTHWTAKEIMELPEDKYQRITAYEKEVNDFDSRYRAYLADKESPHVPKCPTCGSPDLEKIGTASKVLDVAFWGFASGKVKKTFHCNNCGYEW